LERRQSALHFPSTTQPDFDVTGEPALDRIGLLWRAKDLVHIRGEARIDVAEAVAIVILGLRCPNPLTLTWALARTAGKMVSS
jgi:hypothetical protein